MLRARIIGTIIGIVVGLAVQARAGHANLLPVEKLAADGAAAYRAGEYERAAQILEKAYSMMPLNLLLYNLAKTYEKLGDSDKALACYTRYVSAEDADPKLKAKAEARIHSIKESQQPRLEPPPVKLEPPPTKPEPELLRPAPPQLPGSTAAPRLLPPPPRHVVDNSPEHTRRSYRGLALGFSITGAACIGAGLGLGLNAQSLHDQFSQTLIEDQKRSLRTQARAEALAGDVLYAVGGVAVATSIYFYSRWLSTPARRRTAVVPWLSPSSVGIAAETGF